MKVTWLTQAGLLLKTSNLTIMVDPYLSDSLGEKDEKKRRRIPVCEQFLSLRPDVLLITHEHEDHLNPETLSKILDTDKPITVLAPKNAYFKLREYAGPHNYVLLNPHSVWTEGEVTFYAVHAEHSDPTAVGFIIDDQNGTYYISGDTLYNYDVIDDVLDLVEDGVDCAFLPINGLGNNMNAHDAADLAYEIEAKHAIPLHYGLFDDISPDSFDFEDKIILEAYKEVEI
jgi:L-ascorbate 6-phosphate lactonase